MYNELFYTHKNVDEFKIALMSDIHYYSAYNEKIFQKLIKQIKDNNVQYIAIVGDTLDSSDTCDLTKLENFLKELAGIAPTFIVKGNHDEKMGAMYKWTLNTNEKFINLIKSIKNLYYLDDSSVTMNKVTFYGFNMTYKYYEVEDETYESFEEEMKNIKCNLQDDTYNVVLFHSPINIYNFIKNNPSHNLNKSDLILSGHMHNGCFPFIISRPLNKIFKTSRGLISPARTLFPKYAQGRIYERDGFVYEGVTKVSHSTKRLHVFDKFFHKRVMFLTIKRK